VPYGPLLTLGGGGLTLQRGKEIVVCSADPQRAPGSRSCAKPTQARS
jgi:hypothetical protein